MYWRFSFSISPSSEYSGLISFRIDWFEFFLFREFGTREASVTCWLRVYALGTERIGVQFSFCHWLGVQPSTGVSLLGAFICDVRTEVVPRRLWWGCSFNNSDSLAVVGLAEMILVWGLAQCLAHDVVYSLSHVWLFFDPIDCSPLGSSVPGISQARILEWVAMSFSRGTSQPRDWTHVSCVEGGFFTSEPPGKPFFDTQHWSLLSNQIDLWPKIYYIQKGILELPWWSSG